MRHMAHFRVGPDFSFMAHCLSWSVTVIVRSKQMHLTSHWSSVYVIKHDIKVGRGSSCTRFPKLLLFHCTWAKWENREWAQDMTTRHVLWYHWGQAGWTVVTAHLLVGCFFLLLLRQHTRRKYPFFSTMIGTCEQDRLFLPCLQSESKKT